MHIELIDLLRCPVDHEESWLVAAFEKMDGRFVTRAKLGCPVCGATYSIVAGVADLRTPGQMEAGSDQPIASSLSDVSAQPRSVPDDSDTAIRFAAMLNLTRPGMLLVTTGDAAALSHELGTIAEARVIALNPAGPIDEDDRVAIVFTGDRIPIARSSADGVVIGRAERQLPVAEAGRVLKQGGRLVAAAPTNPGPEFRELARDDQNVVAEKFGQLVTLSR